jgi:hypothetical protein
VDLYEERVFEISAIKALRRRLKDANASLEGTGFMEFMGALNTFLTQERAIAELRQARTLARQVDTRVREAVERRIPLLDQDLQELKQRILSVEPQFTQLAEICNGFRDEIRKMRDLRARQVADSFKTYVLGLEHTFEQDFLRYQPGQLRFLDFLSQNKRDEFNAAAQQAFQQYINDKFFAWTVTAEKELSEAFSQLSRMAARYGASYSEVTDRITEKLTGQKIPAGINRNPDDDGSPGWAKWAMGLFSLATGNLAGAAMAVAGFDFTSILLNLFTAVGIAAVASAVFGIVLGPLTFALMSLGIGALQADHARKEFIKALKKELVKQLPQVAQEQWQPIYNGVQECFDSYEREVMKRVNDDIQARRAELNNLLEQKQSREINRDAELNRLRQVESNLSTECQSLETTYQALLVN